MLRDKSIHSENTVPQNDLSAEQVSLGALGSCVLIRGVPIQLVGENSIPQDGGRSLRISSGRPDVLALGRPVARVVESIPRIQ